METRNITDEEFELYSRQIVLNVIGFEGQEKLKNSRVAIVGLGGLGSPIAMTLTAMGVGYIRIIDRDVVEKSNLHRQHLYTFKDIGTPKVEAASKRLKEMNPYVEIDPYPVYIDDSTALEVVRDVDLVLDGLDNFKARRAINKACYKLSIPYIYASAIETYGMVTTLISREGPCLECIFPNISDQNLPTCSTVGVHPSILQIISSIEVYEGVNILMGRKSRLSGKLLVYDLEDLSTTFLDIKKSPNCSVCGGREVVKETVTYPQIEETCSREGRITFIINPGRIDPIEIQKLAKIISEHGYVISNISELGLTFRLDGNIIFSILKTGVGIIEGAHSREYALKVYEDILKKVINF